MTTSLGEHLDRQKFSLWISAAEFPPDHILRGRQVESREILAVDFRRRISARPEILEALLPWLHPLFHIACFCGSASDTLARGMYRSGIGISSCTGRLLPNGARGVREEFIRHAELPPAPGAQVNFFANHFNYADYYNYFDYSNYS